MDTDQMFFLNLYLEGRDHFVLQNVCRRGIDRTFDIQMLLPKFLFQYVHNFFVLFKGFEACAISSTFCNKTEPITPFKLFTDNICG